MRGADTILTETMLDELRAIFGARLRPNEPLSRHGTFGVGGPADAWVSVTREEDLLALVNLAKDRNWPLMLVGNGTNALFSDAGARGVVARMQIDTFTLDELLDGRIRLSAGGG